MRIVIVSALLLGTAACVAPLQQGAICPSSRAMVNAAPPPPPPVVAVAAPAPAPVVLAAYPPVPVPNPGTVAQGIVTKLFGPNLLPPLAPPEAGRLTLSNFTFDLADVEALVTPYPDCGPRPELAPIDFKLPLNSTWIVNAPAGSDICWRRRAPDAPNQGVAQGIKPAEPSWSEWNRAFTASGHYIDARL